MLFLYNIVIRLYGLAIFIASFFKPKAKQWIEGRKNWQQNSKDKLQPNEKRIWVHCASVGEFEQGRNLIEAVKEKYPQYRIVLTFFSPSGYELRNNYQYADYVFYLPIDTKTNAAQFIQTVNPALAIFVKYEFWYHYLHMLHRQNIPAIIISAPFRKEQPFFKWYGGLFRKMLQCFTFIFVQDESSKELIKNIVDETKVIVAGDTRYDRVLSIAANKKQLPLVEHFIGNDPVLIAGSSWQNDEKILFESLSALPANYKLIIAPHEVSQKRIAEVLQFFEGAVLYSSLSLQKNYINDRVLIIDNIGMLSSLYQYGQIAFVGGGFRTGIHNTLEPAVFGLPVIIGPNYKRFIEANLLVEKEFCFPVTNAEECKAVLINLSGEELYYQNIHQALLAFMKEQAGATQKILDLIKL
ncbi:3-deoxy-D-manno-octulosonic acid transferase [Ferruginibacter albus]|uniref:3-deoxy-D-manno-octulosonic acid transferase n=1 Tax=Ferruginibacter albus TaxID=2875540 RepID=UPI001CC5340C|nr:glycosyltransferase N-terminal domain-containing protein [Ferruginibacter albus]UAY51351.1 3-deoxy-D-manno-octulosonic acid transferase [Ferruginibacter albus]